MNPHSDRFRLLFSIFGGLVPSLLLAGPSPRDSAARIEFFEKKIRPILVNNCYTCHSADTNSKGGLRVDDRNGLLNGGNSGPAIVPGDPEESLLIKRVTLKDAKRRMPAEGRNCSTDDKSPT